MHARLHVHAHACIHTNTFGTHRHVNMSTLSMCMRIKTQIKALHILQAQDNTYEHVYRFMHVQMQIQL